MVVVFSCITEEVATYETRPADELLMTTFSVCLVTSTLHLRAVPVSVFPSSAASTVVCFYEENN